MRRKLTIKQIVDEVNALKSTEDRWPVRLAFTHSLDGYKLLVASLHDACDITVSIADERFTNGVDILPNFKKLDDFIDSQSGKIIMITDVSEYLRTCIKREVTVDGDFKKLFEKVGDFTSTTKCILPLFNCDDLFDRVVPVVNDRQINNIWQLSEMSEGGDFSLSIYSSEFGKDLITDVNGLRYWLLSWSDLWTQKKSCSVVTKFSKYAEEQHGDISLKIVNDPFSYAAELVYDGNQLRKGWFSDWAVISSKLCKDESFGDFIKRQFSVTEFEDLAIISRWNSLTEMERQYIWVWYRINPSETYLSYIANNTTKAADIPNNIRDMIFDVQNPSSLWINERKKILKVLSFVKSDATFFTRLNKLPIEQQLELMNFISFDEQVYAFELVGKMLSNGADLSDVLDLYKEFFPIINTYFSDFSASHELTSYFKWYKTSKFKGHNVDFDHPFLDIENYEGRHTLLKKHDNLDTYFLLVDGLGYEWSALLYVPIEEKIDDVNITLNIGRTLLPTETEFNRVWDDYNVSRHKLERFDKLAHSGVPDNKSYYACIAAQFSIIDEISNEVINLIKENNNVIIVGDHGSSRIAALAFHANEGAAPGASWDVRGHGRYCILPSELPFEEVPSGFIQDSRNIDGKSVYFLVSKGYTHFKQRGNAPFEIHGGATPEESLVTILAVSRNTPLPKITNEPPQKRGIVMGKLGI